MADTSSGYSDMDVEDSVAEWSKAIDLKSIILWMRRFKSCHCRFFKVFKFCKKSIVGLEDRVYSRLRIVTEDNVAEWLRRLPAKQFPFGSVVFHS